MPSRYRVKKRLCSLFDDDDEQFVSFRVIHSDVS